MNRNKIAFIICLALGIIGISLYSSTPQTKSDMVITRNSSSQVYQVPQSKAVATIKVQISGAVASPGIYELDKGSRVEELVKLAGGLSPAADLDKTNLAKVVKDGMLISIPQKKTAKTAVNKVNSKTNPSGQVNINTADQQTLQTLKGIGPVLAARIVNWRQINGHFGSKQDLLKVQGIGSKLLSNIEAQIVTD